MPAIAALAQSWKFWLLVALLGLIGFQQVRVSGAKAEAAEARAALSADRQRYAEDTRKAEQEQRKIEGDRIKENERIADEARNQVARAQADARAAAAASAGLRRQVAALLAARRTAGASLGTAAGGPPAADAADLLALVLDRHSSELVEVGSYADRARLAGLACEASYDALVKEVRP